MDITLKRNIHSPEMTRFMNATYYKGRYREKFDFEWGRILSEASDEDDGSLISGNQSGALPEPI